MPSDKDRLYVALYAREGAARISGGEDKLVDTRMHMLNGNMIHVTDGDSRRYYWAFIIGPKAEDAGSRGKRVHAKERPSPSSPSGSARRISALGGPGSHSSATQGYLYIPVTVICISLPVCRLSMQCDTTGAVLTTPQKSQGQHKLIT